MREFDSPRITDRLGAVSAALFALLAAALRLPRPRSSRRPTLVLANRNDGPPDLDELWRDFNRKLSGLFGGKGGGGATATAAMTAAAAAVVPARHEERRHRRRPDRRRRGADLARQRLLHRPGRLPGRHHHLRQVQPHHRRRLPVALSVSDPVARDRRGDAAAVGRGRPQQRWCRPPGCATRRC